MLPASSSRNWLVIALAGLMILAAGAILVGRIIELKKPAQGKRVAEVSIPEGTSAPAETPSAADSYELVIEKLSVSAPIIIGVPGTEEKQYLKALEGGVAQYKGTSLPGEKGNSFIFGHSSYYKNKPGDYKEVFKRLNELAAGDVFKIRHGSETLNYKISKSFTIADDDTSVLNQTENEIVTLMTCWPPGTLEKRWIIQAERI